MTLPGGQPRCIRTPGSGWASLDPSGQARGGCGRDGGQHSLGTILCLCGPAPRSGSRNPLLPLYLAQAGTFPCSFCHQRAQGLSADSRQAAQRGQQPGSQADNRGGAWETRLDPRARFLAPPLCAPAPTRGGVASWGIPNICSLVLFTRILSLECLSVRHSLDLLPGALLPPPCSLLPSP